MNKINQKFNTMTLANYRYFIENHKKFSDFNTLGLYRSLGENEKITIDEKIQVRDFAHQFFAKSFEFLQIKDPMTYMAVKTLGQDLTEADKKQLWKDVEFYQQKTLAKKRIKHRSFGTYTKHNCGDEHCYAHQVMGRTGSLFVDSAMMFESDGNRDIKNLNKRHNAPNKKYLNQKELHQYYQENLNLSDLDNLANENL